MLSLHCKDREFPSNFDVVPNRAPLFKATDEHNIFIIQSDYLFALLYCLHLPGNNVIGYDGAFLYVEKEIFSKAQYIHFFFCYIGQQITPVF